MVQQPSNIDTVCLPNSPRTGTLALEPIDIVSLRWLIQCTLIFDHTIDDKVLKAGLSGLLDHYPFLGGRITHGNTIAYEGEGIPFSTRTENDLSISDFEAHRTNVDALADRRKIKHIKRGRAPLMTVRLTKLKDGCVLGICCSHACFDGTGFFTMIRSWNRAALGQPVQTPIFERPTPPTATRSKAEVTRNVIQQGWSRLSLCDGIRYLCSKHLALDRKFVTRFSTEAIRRCQRACSSELEGMRVSTNTALVAHVTNCLTTLLKFDKHAHFTVSVVADKRSRLGLPSNYVGNASAIIATDPIPASASQGEIASRIHKQLKHVLARSSSVLATNESLMAEVIRHRIRYFSFPLGNMIRRRPSHFYTNSFGSYPIYDLDFCGSKPIRVVPHNLSDPILLWSAPPDQGGVELYLSGPLAKAVRALEKNDTWWSQLSQFDNHTQEQ